MQAAPGRIFVKTGAEGVYCAAVPELGLGIALKCDDGAGPRGGSGRRGGAGEAVRAGRRGAGGARRSRASRQLKNWNGIVSGRPALRP